MRRVTAFVRYAFYSVALFAILVTPGLSAEKLPAEKAGEISRPSGQIAFAREKSIWVMNADGSGQRMITDVRNADGRMSWSPDNRKIVFTRSGTVDLRGPDMLGGRHKVYDLFVAFLDSADADPPNTNFWNRLTDDLGSRDPQWTKDNKIIFWKDMNANMVNATEPNYQIEIMDADGANVQVLRKDWQNLTDFFTSPSINSKGDIAFVFFYSQRPQGLVVLPKAKMMMSPDSIKVLASKMPNCVAPAWSPDGKWLAYVLNDINNPGIYIAAPDLSEKYVVFEPPVGASLYTVAPSFSPDSKWLTFSTNDGSVWTCDITGNTPRRLTGPGIDAYPAWSQGAAK